MAAGQVQIGEPGYWMYETSGVLILAVSAYIRGDELTAFQVRVMRAYLRQWINAPGWAADDGVEALKTSVEEIRNTSDVTHWLDAAEQLGIDPL